MVNYSNNSVHRRDAEDAKKNEFLPLDFVVSSVERWGRLKAVAEGSPIYVKEFQVAVVVRTLVRIGCKRTEVRTTLKKLPKAA